MNSLKDIPLKRHYDPSRDGTDLAKELYNPCLSVAVSYDRISPYFSSDVLKSFAEGLHLFTQRKGKIRFIFSYELEKDVQDEIVEGYEKRRKDRSIEIRSNSSLRDSYEICNLGYLIEKGYADVRIAFRRKDKASILHRKSGLFTDAQGNKVYFSGSGNETVSGTKYNAEDFTICKSFSSEEQNSDVLFGEKRFEDIWNNRYGSSVHTEVPSRELFSALMKFSRGRPFFSEEEYDRFRKEVFIDIDRKSQRILLSDYTENHWLSYPFNRKSYVKGFEKTGEDSYRVGSLSLHILRDLIVERLKRKRIPRILSDQAKKYRDENNLELDKRAKLGLAIKEGKEKERWEKSYLRFRSVVDEERTARLKDRQRLNAFYHYRRVSSCDFSVPGTGKTYISYGLYAYLSSPEVSKCSRLVVFGPLNCFPAWKEEGKNIFFGKRDLSFFDITEHKNDYESVLRSQAFDVYLFNFEFLGNSGEKIQDKIHLIQERVLNRFSRVVFDEIHKLKSLTGVTAMNYIRLVSSCLDKPLYRLALTGTPLPNSFADILNILRILYADDRDTLFSAFSENSLRQADNDPSLADKAILKLSPYFVRTTKKDLRVPLPDPDDRNSLLTIPTLQEEELYRQIKVHYQSQPLLKYIRLIQAASNPRLLSEKIAWGDILSFYDDEDNSGQKEDVCPSSVLSLSQSIDRSSKRKAALKKTKELVQKGKKVLIWCLFVGTIDEVRKNLKQDGILADSICGRDSIPSRNSKLNEFKYGKTQVLCTNPNTLAESVSLHLCCHDAIYLEYGFNLTYRLQSKDRINRVGLKEGVHTHYYYAIASEGRNGEGPVDRLVLQRLKEKEKRRMDAIESGKLSVLPDSDSFKEDILSIIEKR